MNIILASIIKCIVGCCPGSNEALLVMDCDTETGESKIVQTIDNVSGTTYFQLNRDKTELYTMIDEGKKGSIVRYSLNDGKLGKMKKLTKLPCETPCHIALSPDEKEVTFAAYTSGTYGAVSLENNKLFTGVFSNEEHGPCVDRQLKAYAHCAFYLPDGKTFGIIDLGCDRICFFERTSDGLKEKKEMMIKTDVADGPRHAIFSSNGKFLFVLNELSSSVSSYSFDGKIFKKISKVPLLPDGTNPMISKAAAIKLTADGKVLMASNRGFDSIVFCDVKDDGSLVFRNRAKINGKYPRDFELMPGEKFMIVGHKMSDEIQVYSFNREKYTLTPVGKSIKCYHPLCFKFLK